MRLVVYAAIVLNFIILLAYADDMQSQIDMTQPCIYPVPVGLEKRYIPDKNLWATSQINSKRGAQYARLRNWRGGGAWTSSIADSKQYLGIDLGYRQVLTGVATQGRRGSNEYVIEYYLWYSNDNYTWRVYTNEFGSPLLLIGNSDDNTVAKYQLPYQVVAQYVRINPQRWYRFISLRADLYGCRFDADDAQFDGLSRITYDLSGPMQYVQSRDDLLKLRFRTNTANGLIFYADGNQGDYMILELVNGRLFLNYNLGATPEQSGDTTMRAGSLLDDNQWHDVLITRSDRNITFKVDQMFIFNVSISDFIQLDLDRKIHLGGIDNFLQPGKRMQVRQNFTGCMENVWFNYMNIIQDSRMNVPRYSLFGQIFFGACQLDSIVPISIPFVDTYIKITDIPTESRIRVTFDFRSYNPDGLLFLHTPSGSEKYMLKITPEGYINYVIQTKNNPIVSNTIVNSLSDSNQFTDGLWHSVEMDVQSSSADKVGSVKVVVDKQPDVSVRQLSFISGNIFDIAGGDFSGGETGFIGCLRRLYIQGQQVLITNDPLISGKFTGKITTYGGVVNGSCALQDRCDPNPCEHLGSCSQNYDTFSCDCGHTGYTGAVCHRSLHMASCEEIKLLNPFEQNVKAIIDIDDSGPLLPFPVNCIFQEKPLAVMELGHDTMTEMVVDGFSGPGSYVRLITYVAQKEEIDEIIRRAIACEQSIRYSCFQSRLLADAGNTDPNIPSWGWFVSKEMTVERYWGGSAPDSGKCACGLMRECKSSDGGVSNLGCNCDSSIANDDVADEGYLQEKDRLPVKELHFGDTGNINDEKWGKHLLGPLRCEGDIMFQNTITFRIEDATVALPTYNGVTTGDIRFQIKTTAMEGIIFQNTGPNDHFIETRIVFGNVVQFRFNAGNGIQTLEVLTSYPVNDNEWHTIQVERNRRQAMLRVDQQQPQYLDEPTDQEFRELILTSSLVVGAAVDYSEGYVGCIRAFMVNGVLQDLRGIVESGAVTYGVAIDCIPKCMSNPCYNGGICVEYYSRYWCDCGYTPYRGWNCGREVGVTMLPNYMLRYEFDPNLGDITTTEENIYIGFSSMEKRGMLMFIRSDSKPMEYLLIEINNNGGIRVAIDVGIYRDELNTDKFIVPYVDLTNGQQHVVHVYRTNQGRTLSIAVDDYPVASKTWDVVKDGDTRLDNPRYIYFGRNETTTPGQGFKGCLFRAQWDNQFPIKRVFQDPRGKEIVADPSKEIIEDMCGFIELSHKPDPAEYRNTPDFRVPTTTPYWGSVGGDGYSLGDQILIGVLVSVFIILLLGVIFLIRRYYYNNKRSYKTYEAKDAEYFESPDYALMAGASKQPEIQKTKEYLL